MKNNIIDLKNRLNNIKKIARNKKKKTAIFISNTKKIKKINFYFTPIRETENYIYFGVVLFDGSIAKEIARKIDGKLDIIFVDTEKKSYLNKKNKVVNVEKTIKQNIKKSYLRFYKANDLTVNAAEDLLGIYFKDEIRNLAGKKILIIGVGNIGFKLSLRLIERGCSIYLYRRDKKKLKEICKIINFIKPKGTIVKAYPITNILKNLKKFDVIFCAANTENVLKISNKNELKKDVFLIDIGKGMLSPNSVKLLNKLSIDIHRLDVTPSLNMLLESSNTFKNFEEKKKYLVRKINNYRLISPGLLGQKFDVIVDDVSNPNFIYGVCDGLGDFIRINKKQKLIITKEISSKINKRLSFH